MDEDLEGLEVELRLPAVVEEGCRKGNIEETG
jgi:hypothetical protein